MPSLSIQLGHESVNSVVVVPFMGEMEHDPFDGGSFRVKLIAVEAASVDPNR